MELRQNSYVLLYSIFKKRQMGDQIQVLELSLLSKEDILRRVTEILTLHEVQKFTILVKCKSLNAPLQPTPSPHIHNPLPHKFKSSIVTAKNRVSQLQGHRVGALAEIHSQNLIDEIEEVGESDSEIGMRFYREGKFQQAVDMLKVVRKEGTKGCKGEERQISIYLANAHFQLQQYKCAMEIYKEVLQGGWEWKEREREWGQVQNNLGCCYGKLGHDKLSMGAYGEALKVYLKYPQVDCSPLFANIANLYFSCKMFAVAEKYYFEAIAQRKNKKPHAKQLLYHAYHKLGLAQMEQRKLTEANDSLKKAVRLAQSGFGDVLEVLSEAAVVSELEERWEEALEYYEQLHEQYERTGKSKANLYEQVSKLYSYTGKAMEAAKYKQMAIEDYRRLGDFQKVKELNTSKSISSKTTSSS